MSVFDKAALTPSQQLDLLIERGLWVRDYQRALRLLEVTSLFRMSPYMRPFQDPRCANHTFRPNAELAEVVQVYRFDSRLRQLIMVAIERVEVAARACISNTMAPKYGAHWYLDKTLFKKSYHSNRLIEDLERQLSNERKKFAREQQQIEKSQAPEAVKQRRIENRKRDNYPRFYGSTYTQPPLLPSWAMVEELSLGAISHLYQGLAKDKDRKLIAQRFGLPQNVLGSWLHTLTFIRNICAHHARLWNRELGIPPRWPNNVPTPDGRHDKNIPRRLFTVVTMLVYLTRQISPDTGWPSSLQALLQEHPAIPLDPMGFPQDWRERLRPLNAESAQV